jgi:hypothetical protein
MEKTLNDFKAVSGVMITIGDDRAVTSLIDSPFTDILLFAFLIFICLSFISERSTGLWEIVYATQRGRMHLSAQRVVCILMFTFLSTTLLFLPKILFSFLMYNGYGQLSRSVQSIPAFSKFLVPINVKDFLILYFSLKLVSSFFVTLLIWMAFSFHTNANMAIFFTSIFLALEYSLYILPESNFLVAVKYINVFFYIQPVFLLEVYRNISFFGSLQNISYVSIGLILPMIALVVGIQVFWMSQKRPGNKSVLGEKFFNRITLFASRITPCIPSVFREFHKKLILEKWLFPFCVLIFLTYSYQAPQSVINDEDVYKQFYYQQFHNVDGVELTNALNAEKHMINENIDELLRTFSSESGDRQFGSLVLLEQFTNRQSAIESIEQEVLEINAANQRYEIKAVLSDPYLVEAILGTAGNNYRKIRALLIMLFLVLLSSTLIPFERQENVLPIIKATRGGALLLWKKKGFVHFVFFIIIYICIYGPELIVILSQKYISFNGAIQSFPSFRDFPYNLSLSAFLLVLYGYRFVIAIGFSFLIVFISSFVISTFRSALLLIFSIVIPSAIIAFMSDQFYIYTPIFPFSALQPVSDIRIWILFLYPIIFLLFAIMSCQRMKKIH